jgi:predicted TIM-barrel fold metal-dependent hydrolase
MPPLTIVDPHIHLFNLSQGEYDWLSQKKPPFWSDKPIINRNFYQPDLTLTEPLALSGFVHIEAGFDNARPWREIEWLEQHCTLPFRSIAGIDLTLATALFSDHIERLISYPSVVGIRHVLGNLNEQLCGHPQVLSNLRVVNQFALNVELQLALAEMEKVDALMELITVNNEIDFVIEHAGLPPLAKDSIQWQRWQTNLTSLAQCDNVAIKCSGWEMLTRHYQDDWLKCIITTCIHLFSNSRVMLASNFPLVLFSRQYQDYWQQIISQVDIHDQQALLHDNAIHYYKITNKA